MPNLSKTATSTKNKRTIIKQKKKENYASVILGPALMRATRARGSYSRML